MKTKIFMGMAAVAFAAILAGCGKTPQTEIDATNAAIEAAKAAEADIYLPAEFAALQDKMNAVNTAVEEQKGKLLKKFTTVKEDLAAVTAEANQVAANVVAKKDEVKAQAQTLMNDIKAVVEENAKLLPKLPRGKEGAAVIEQIKADLGTVDTAVAEAQGLFDKGAFMDAYNKIKAASEKANALNTEIKEVLTKARIRF
ncbi:MAG: hypothetical protein JXR66_03085 [Bacteroidales bacterium]|nr:hypothetical protein [Bacteroidales bacterium]MBN2632514.1 hypothetical protein [Bacteroidales bacterium]